MPDEAHFFLDGSVSKKNCRIWATERPTESVEHDPYAPHITVWCAVSHCGVIGSYLFQQRSNTVTVTGIRYKTMLEKFFLSQNCSAAEFP